MFERYTESGRRVVFFARYEASQYGCRYIEPEHILLAIYREDKKLTNKLLANVTLEDIRKQVEARIEIRPATSTSIDLPLSTTSRQVLAYAAGEAERLAHTHIAPKHLLLALLREEDSLAAKVLRDNGLRMEAVRQSAAKPDIVPGLSISPLAKVSIVTITSNPSGAEIELDGKFLGTTPAEVPLIAREWTVRIAKTGFVAWERKLLVLPAAKQNIAVDLVKPE